MRVKTNQASFYAEIAAYIILSSTCGIYRSVVYSINTMELPLYL